VLNAYLAVNIKGGMDYYILYSPLHYIYRILHGNLGLQVVSYRAEFKGGLVNHKPLIGQNA